MITLQLYINYCNINRYNTEKMVHILKPLTYLIVESLNTDWLVDFIKTQESISSIKMSTALAHSLNETSKQISLKTLSKFLIEMFIKAEVQKEVVRILKNTMSLYK